jgi:aerobic-type carbon monoxide dehydrogenase small subunit (CoxS/CutS family)
MPSRIAGGQSLLATLNMPLSSGETLSRADIRGFIDGNMCRCTGYHAIVDAVEAVMARRGES